MKTFFLTLCLLSGTELLQAAPFRNLGFEEAITNNILGDGLPPPFLSYFYGPFEELLPGWKLAIGPDGAAVAPVGNIGFNLLLTGGGPGGGRYLTLIDANNPWGITGPDKYAFLMAHSTSRDLASLVQVGEVPGDAKSIQFVAAGRPLELRLNQQLVPLRGLPGAIELFGDVSAFAGQTVELRFTMGGSGSNVFVPWSYLDRISFSPLDIPEPAVWALLLLGAAGWLWQRRFR